MATSQHTSETIPARVIATYSDAELDKYLNDHRLGNGGPTIVNVEDPENLPESFIERLRDRAQGTTKSSQSRPIDLDELTARLLATTGSNTSLSPALRGRRLSSTPPPIPAEVPGREAYNKPRNSFPPFTRGSSEETIPPVPTHVHETQAYDDLVKDGGRPLYPNHLIDEFRLRSASYTKAAKKLLAEYAFVRPFQLHDDPKQQDALTTWIEYLAYACAVHYRHTCLVKKYQPGYDAAWKALVESKVLRPSETKENICTFDVGAKHDRETAMAVRAVKAAEAALEAVQKRQGSSRQQRPRPRVLATAQTRLDAARNDLESLRNRSHHLENFAHAVRTYRIAKTNTTKSNVKLRWILEQVPLVEAELKEAGAAQSVSHTGRSTKRKRKDAEGVTDVVTSKRLRKASRDGVTKAVPANETFTTRTSSTAPARALTVQDRSERPTRGPEAPKNLWKGPRRSRRLAGQAPEFGLDGKAVADAKPQVIPRSGKTRTAAVASRTELLPDD
ncbi:hypothetical protein DL546_004051 [Coniochaeta pulveracea]|uniref:Uncharacterized protein n=1 Tax=Coniochaeta pulveracea TaxID=177199 RepID=A0A420Y6Y2_9PEZI|nr:hypothetical protein DL546_004051 [Coniochaeta pulveracea]